MSIYDHKIETSLEGIEHLSKEKKEERENMEKMRCGKGKVLRVLLSGRWLPRNQG